MEKETWRLEKEQMVKDFHVWNKDAVKGQTVFTGSSLMEMFPIEKWAKELGPNAPIVYNRGVGGYRTTDLLPILDACVFELKPRKVFINIGTNDLSDGNIPLRVCISNRKAIVPFLKISWHMYWNDVKISKFCLYKFLLTCTFYYPINTFLG